jgi:ubiquitin-conjugating enzyme E2 J2
MSSAFPASFSCLLTHLAVPLQYCDEGMKDLPNMGERDRGVSPSTTDATASSMTPSTPTTPSSSTTTPRASTATRPAVVAAPALSPAQRASATLNPGPSRAAQTPMKSATGSGTAPNPSATSGASVAAPGPPVPVPTLGWGASWREALWDKWRWGILIVLAISVSRLSSL